MSTKKEELKKIAELDTRLPIEKLMEEFEEELQREQQKEKRQAKKKNKKKSGEIPESGS